MVYGFFMIACMTVGAVYWMATSNDDENVKDLMWSPGSGLIEPEPWLKSPDGGYTGWSPGRTIYNGWSPGAYLNLFTPAITTAHVTSTTTRRTTRTRRTRLPPTTALPESSPPEDLTPPSESSPGQIHPPSDQMGGRANIADPERRSGTYAPPRTLFRFDYEISPIWRSKDHNEEAYEENPQDLVNTRPPDKLPVDGWGYDYDNTG